MTSCFYGVGRTPVPTTSQLLFVTLSDVGSNGKTTNITVDFPAPIQFDYLVTRSQEEIKFRRVSPCASFRHWYILFFSIIPVTSHTVIRDRKSHGQMSDLYPMR